MRLTNPTMIDTLLFLLVAAPMGAALLCLAPLRGLRSAVVLVTGAALAISAALLVFQAPFAVPAASPWGLDLAALIRAADLALLGLFALIGLRRRSLLILLPALAQLGLVIWLEFFLVAAPEPPRLVGDNLSLILVLVVCVVGSLICAFALPYMRKHEELHGVRPSAHARFFAVLLLFLGAMNGLALSDDLTWLYFFFELTTLCSYLLIAHDNTAEAVKNAVKALWMNSLGGLAFAVAMAWGWFQWGSLDLSHILAAAPQGAMLGPVALLCLAGMVKAAQPPFQGWLLGAMVAPTPTSALLHSSTMVKAGVYMVLRLAPCFAGAWLSFGVALAGSFAFFATAALAVGQSNGKRILAYSTVGNLGLILACAGVNTPLAVTAALLLVLFHAVTKGLLFLCVGAVEQEIGSRDVEDMRDLYGRMPLTALFAVAGILAMILPPFGMLLGKWLALQSVAGSPALVVLLALGSALTVLYWARWAGGLLGNAGGARPRTESQALLIRLPLALLTFAALCLGLAAPWLSARLEFAMLRSYNALEQTTTTWIPQGGNLSVLVFPLYGLAALGVVLALWARGRAGRSGPYMAGAQVEAGPGVAGSFVGPMNRPVRSVVGNYYLSALFGEKRWTVWLNLASGALLLLLLAAGWLGGRA